MQRVQLFEQHLNSTRPKVLGLFSFEIESYHYFRSFRVISHISNDSTAISQLRHWEMKTHTPHTKSHYIPHPSGVCLKFIFLNPLARCHLETMKMKDATSGINISDECEFVVLAPPSSLLSSSLCDQVSSSSKLKSCPKFKFKHGNRPRHPVCTFHAND